MFERIIKRIKSLTPFELFALVTIISFTIFVVKYFGQKVEYRLVRVEIINKSWSENFNPYGYRTPFWLSDKLRVGQKEYDKSGQVIAEVVDIENFERGSEEAEVYLTMKLRTVYQKRLHQYQFKNKALDLGAGIELSPDQNIVFGQIIDTDVKESGYPKKEFTITARGRGVDQYLINKIKNGETMNNRYDQTPVATIVNFHTEPTTRIYVNELTDNNRTLGFKLSPKNEDIVVSFKVKTQQVDGRWYFAGHQQIKVGGSFYFYGQNINLYGLEIEDVQ